MYLEAKLDAAQSEQDKAAAMYTVHRNAYTEGKLLWSKHYVAAMKMALRDVHAWRATIKRYRKKLEKRIKKVVKSATEQQTIAPIV